MRLISGARAKIGFGSIAGVRFHNHVHVQRLTDHENALSQFPGGEYQCDAYLLFGAFGQFSGFSIYRMLILRVSTHSVISLRFCAIFFFCCLPAAT